MVIQEVDFYKDFIPNEILEQYIEIKSKIKMDFLSNYIIQLII